MELNNNTILITGGTSGLGYEFANRLIDLGNTVIITGRDRAKLDLTKSKLPGVHIFQSDVSDPEAIKSLYQKVIDEFPKLNVLINNAGEMRKIDLQDASTTIDDIAGEIDINLSGPIRMVQQFLPHLNAQSNAAIVNVTSGIALVPFPLSPVYGATKSGLRSYTKSLRVQLKNTDIKVFELVAPGAKTPLNDKFAEDVDSKMLMETDKLIDVAIEGIQHDKFEIYPGIAKILKIMSRLAPSVIFNQMSKVAEKSLAKTNA
jgi:uncharacterized oxidoreductase